MDAKPATRARRVVCHALILTRRPGGGKRPSCLSSHAAALPHTPQLLVRPDTEDRDLVLRVHAAYAAVKAEIAAARPDVICLIGGDHIEGFFLNAVPALAVFVGAAVSGTFDRYRFTFPVHEPLARAIVEQGIDRGFDLAYSQDLPSTTPSTCRSTSPCPSRRVPIVPLYVNVYLPPQPTPRRCYAWGQALRAILDARPERVALIASGGLSHYPGHRPLRLARLRVGPPAAGALAAGRGRGDGARSPARSSTRRATWSSARGSRSSARWATRAPRSSATSPRGTTATPW